MRNPEHQSFPDGTRVRFTDRAKQAMRPVSVLDTPLGTPALGADVLYTIDNTDDSFHDVVLRETGERYGVAWLTRAKLLPYDPARPDVTREGITVQEGQVWADLDKRMAGRKVTVTLVESGGRVVVRDSMGRMTRLSVRRMHNHSTGFRLVCAPAKR